MLSCLSLVNRTHVRSSRDGEQDRTVCGMSVLKGFAEPGLFAVSAEEATCESCRRVLTTPTTATVAADPKSLLRKLFDDVLTKNEPGGLVGLLDDRLAFSAHRLTRLHELFPTWRATIVDLIAEGERVVVRYDVDYMDTFGLADAVGATRKINQTVIFRFAGHRIAGIDPLVDDFALWAGVSQVQIKEETL